MAIIFTIMISFITSMTNKKKENYASWYSRIRTVGIITKYTTTELSLWKRFSNAIHGSL